MVQRDSRVLVRVAGHAVHVAADDSQRMGDHRGHMAVLLNVFGQGVAHEAPPADVAHTRDIGKKVIGHYSLSFVRGLSGAGAAVDKSLGPVYYFPANGSDALRRLWKVYSFTQDRHPFVWRPSFSRAAF